MKIIFLGYSARWPEKKTRAMEAVLGPEICQIGGPWESYFRYLPHLWLAMHRYKPHAIMAQTVYHGLLALFLRPRTPLVVENHGDLPCRNKKVAKIALRRAGAFRAVSRFTANQFFAYGLRHIPPIYIFPPWTDLDLFFKANVIYKKPRQKIIVYAGELAFHKGIHVLLEAFSSILSEHPDAKLRIIGKATDSQYMKEIVFRAQGLPVSIEKPMAQEKLAKVMTQADVVAVPSLREGFGRVALEAMACGTPVVASHVGGLPEIVEHTRTGYLAPPNNSHLLAFWIKHLLEYPHVGEFLGIWGQKKAREIFSTEKYVGAYKELFDATIRRNNVRTI